MKSNFPFLKNKQNNRGIPQEQGDWGILWRWLIGTFQFRTEMKTNISRVASGEQ